MSKAFLLISNDRTWLEEQTVTLLRQAGIFFGSFSELTAMPDCLVLSNGKTIGIADIREVQAQVQRKPFQAAFSSIIIQSAQCITLEGQNALLKTLEEPPATASIFLWAESKDQLLPTIVSRCFLSNDGSVRRTTHDEAQAQSFVKTSLFERLVGSKEWASGKIEAASFLENLMHYYRKQLRAELATQAPQTQRTKQLLQHLISAQIKLAHGVNPRLVIDGIAIQLGQEKRMNDEG